MGSRSAKGLHSIILEAGHPSGLSARRGFFGCNHFNLANEALIKQGNHPLIGTSAMIHYHLRHSE